jgi:tetraacyldisaccharide 4'-kinase
MEDLPIVMTEKDAIKCKFLKNPNCWYLKIESNLSDDFQSQILEKISI